MISPLLLLLLAVGYAVWMKVADLFNEHGLRSVNHGDILFGILWGASGSLLVIFGGDSLANILLAMNLAMILRNRIDFLNHQMATVGIIIAFLFSSHIFPLVFLPSFFAIWGLGALKDSAEDRYEYNSFLYWLAESMLYYPLITLSFSIAWGEWIVFWVFLVYTVSYNLTKIYAIRRGYV